MSQSRISALCIAAEAMLQGDFHPKLPRPEETPDEVDTLAALLEQLGRRVEASIEELQMLAELTEKINSGHLVEEVLEHVFDSFHTVIPYDRIGCALLEDGGRIVRSFWAKSRTTSAMHLGVGYAAPMHGSSLQSIIDTGRPRIINDLEQHLTQHPTSKSTRRVLKDGVRSSLTCPLVAMSKPIGFLFFSSSEPNKYASAHVEFFMRVARQLSTVLEKGRLYKELLDAKIRAERASTELARLASLDGLTGIANRRAFDERLEAECRHARRKGKPLSALLLDIDHFKKLNDTYGHLAGDECLKAVGRVLHATIQRSGDFVARYGGEEFTVLLPNTDEDGAMMVAEVIRAEIQTLAVSMQDGAPPLRMTVSIGVATMRGPYGAVDLVRAADEALYAAKESGRNRIVRASSAAALIESPLSLAS